MFLCRRCGWRRKLGKLQISPGHGMIYGLYLSASGVLANSLKQDVIANNLANTETVGFRRTLADVRERKTQTQEQSGTGDTNALLEGIGGGLWMKPSSLDQEAGSLDPTNQNLDLAVHGKGYFAVQDGDHVRLTRNGHFILDKTGTLVLGDGSRKPVLDANKKPISIQGVPGSALTVGEDGSINIQGSQLAKLGLFNVADEKKLSPHSATLLDFDQAGDLTAADGEVRSGFLENSNVDPMVEMTNLIECQRQLETNANMIRMQDQSLQRLVNDVAKTS